MNHDIHFADEDLRHIEKTVYEITASHGNKVLDGEYILGKVFEKGFSFEHLSKKRIKQEILSYLRRWTKYWLEQFSFRDSENRSELNIEFENIQLLKEFIRLAPKSLPFLLNFVISIAVKSIKEPGVLNFLSTVNRAILTPAPQDLEKLRRPLPFLLNSETKDEISSLPIDKFEESRASSVESQESVGPHDNEENIEELSYLDRLLYCIERLLTEYQEISEEQMMRVFEKFQVNLDEASIAELTRAMHNVAISAIERIINEDEYMGYRFNNDSLDEIDEKCKDLEDIESKDCRLCRLYYYWILAQEGYSRCDLKVYTFLEPRISFNNLERNLIEFLKGQINKKKVEEKERTSVMKKLKRKTY